MRLAGVVAGVLLVVADAADAVLLGGCEVGEHLGELDRHHVRVDDRQRSQVGVAAQDGELVAGGHDRAADHDGLGAGGAHHVLHLDVGVLGDRHRVEDHVGDEPVDGVDGAAVALQPVQADTVAQLGHRLEVVGHDRERVAEQPRQHHGRLERTDDRDVHELAALREAGVVATPDDEGVEAVALGFHRGHHDLGLGEVLGGVVVDVARGVCEVADLDVGRAVQRRPQGGLDQLVVAVGAERVEEADACHGDPLEIDADLGVDRGDVRGAVERSSQPATM